MSTEITEKMQENKTVTDVNKEDDSIEHVEMPSGYITSFQIFGRYAFSDAHAPFFINITNGIEKLKGMKIRQDDVILVTYPKSGTHWVSEILKMVTAGKAEYSAFPKRKEMIDCQSFNDLEELESPRILNTHVHVHDLPYGIVEKECKTVIVHRNPKDVLVSQYCQAQNLKIFQGTWEDYLFLFTEDEHPLFTDWFAYIRDAHYFATKHNFVHTLFYEDLKQNMFDEVRKLAKFLCVQLSDDVIQGIVEKCSFENLKEATMKKPMFSEVKHKMNIFRKGQIGDWKNWFTVAQSERFDSAYKTKMQGCDIQFTFAVKKK